MRPSGIRQDDGGKGRQEGESRKAVFVVFTV